MSRAMTRLVLVTAVLVSTAVMSQAQQQTTSTATKNFEVIGVDGNMLIVRLPEGTREMVVPADYRFTVDGQSMSVQELKPGMKGTATITTRTTTTPVTVTEVKNGTVVQRSGSTLIVRTPEGVKSFSQSDVDKRGVKILRDGEPAELSDFREGDTLSATIVTTRAPRVLTEREVSAILAKAPAAPAPVAAAPAPAPVPTSGETRELPKTASSWPLLGLASLLSLAMGLGLSVRRRIAG